MGREITVYMHPDEQDIRKVITRPSRQREELDSSVRQIMAAVRKRGDRALVEFAASYDRAEIPEVLVPSEEIQSAAQQVRPDLRMAIRKAATNIRTFHTAQVPREEQVQTAPGVSCWRRVRAIERVGLYVPGGTAPLFSTVLMLAIPAAVAGCREIVLATPPGRDGAIHPAILYAASISGVTTVIRAGGAQAIAAMAWGTESIRKVDKIFGPGNQYVTRAKELVSAAGTAIDMPAGPSEVMIIADTGADPAIVAADMLSQAEHGPDSQVVAIVEDLHQIDPILRALSQQLKTLPRRDFAEQSLGASSILCIPKAERALDVINRYAPEHLIIIRRDAEEFAEGVQHAGSVFIGPWTPESAGDYASGTNHTLPTNGWARSYSGVSLDSFVKKITFQKISSEGLEELGPVVEILARAESLEGHKRAVSLRLEKIQANKEQ